LKYELQSTLTGDGWGTCITGPQSLDWLRRAKRRLEGDPVYKDYTFRIVEMVPDPSPEPKPTIEEKHAAELRDLEEREKRWARKAKRAATELKKIRRRKRRLERLYAPRSEPA
jgi:hypothetical protein